MPFGHEKRHRIFNFLLATAPGLASIVAAVGSGELTPSEASELTRLVEGYARVLETVDHEERLKALEGRINGNKS
jgi:hypothetical protein